MTTRFSISFPPCTGNSQYAIRKGGGRFLRPEVRRWREDCCLLIPAVEFPDNGRISLSIVFFAPDFRKRDADNHLKPVLDAIKAAWQIDDSQFDLAGVKMKVDLENPRVEVSV